MSSTSSHNSVLRFGAFEFAPQTGILYKNGRSVALQPQPGKVLSMLISRPGELITREEIQVHVWGKDTFVDFEHNINFAVRQIRAALKDDAEKPRFIETLPRRGYRFIATVEEVAPSSRAVLAGLYLLPAKGHSVGRERERAELATAFESAVSGRGVLLCVAGEPGIGKTTLVQDFLSDLQASGKSFNLAVGRAAPSAWPERKPISLSWRPLRPCLAATSTGSRINCGRSLRAGMRSSFPYRRVTLPTRDCMNT